MADEMTLALRWLRAKQWIDDRIEGFNESKPSEDEYWRGFENGAAHILGQLKASYFLSDEEAAESWKMRKEMGF